MYLRTERQAGRYYRYIHQLECNHCGEAYERISANKAPLPNGWCSKECKKQHLRETHWVSLECQHCKETFEVPESLSRPFCSHECYWADMKANPETYDLYSKAEKARVNSNTPTSIDKMRETKMQKGSMIDWKDATWKQYWKKCNDLTRKMRSEMLEGWDGLDYLDGKPIRENLNLPYSHGDYPTLDHVIPRSECYKQGIPPQQACSKENLRWTTRRNNSAKYNKKHDA